MLSEDAAALMVLGERAGRKQLREMLRQHDSPTAALQARSRLWRGRIRQQQLLCEKLGIGALMSSEAGFPPRLRQIPDAPLLMFYRGELPCYTVGCADGDTAEHRRAAAPAVAVVGARRASRLGLEIAGTLARTLGRAGVRIISGLALGIDSAAHHGALDSNVPGATVAVVGSGLGCVQPVTNIPLAEAIVRSSGVLFSEYAPMTQARPHHFPERNRLISGLADVVVVVEAGERSGSLITARLALEQGREVLAVPGSVAAANSRGVNQLLKQGAGLVDCAQDVLDVLDERNLIINSDDHSSVPTDQLSATARALFDQLRDATFGVDELCQQTGYPAAQVNALLAELELAGFVARSGDSYIRRPLA